MATTRKSSRQNVIKLGPTRSPKKKCPSNFENTQRNLHSRFSSYDQKSVLCEVIQPKFQINRNKTFVAMPNNRQYNRGSEMIMQKSPIKPNIDHQANFHQKVLLYHSSQRQDNVFSKQMKKQKESEQNLLIKKLEIREQQLTRKNRILEQRISELHQQKQTCILQMNQETRRLNYEMQHLKCQLQNLFDIKHKQAQLARKDECLTSKKRPISSSKGIKSQSSLKNDVYVQNDQEDITTSILKIKKEVYDDASLNSQNAFKPQLMNLELQSDSKHEKPYPDQKQTKECAINTSFDEIQSRKSSKSEEKECELLKEYKNKVDQIQCFNEQLIKENNLLKEQVESLKRVLLENSSLSEKNQNMIQSYESQVLKMTSTVEELNSQLTQKSQKINIVCEEKQKIKKKLTLANQSLTQKLQEFQSEREQLQNQIKILENQIKILTQPQKTQQGIQVKVESISQQCAKCQEIMKTFLKLNSKAYQK